MWLAGDFDDLLDEGRCIQAHLRPQSSKGRNATGLDDTMFSRLVFSGRIQAASRMVQSGGVGRVLRMEDCVSEDKTVRDVLLEKHPLPQLAAKEILQPDEAVPANPILFDRITSQLIKTTSRSMSGSAGPSGIDAEGWIRMLTCYGSASNNLSSALAASARVLCTEDIDPSCTEALTAARLVPLDKSPGVRPIAVGEVFRRIMCRAIMKIIESDVRDTTAPRQLCVGVPSACEASVHAMDSLFNLDSTDAILLVDASNAFNSLNREAALHNVPILCPALGQVFKNTYKSPSRLFVTGGGEILSREGTCQGDPLAMAIYAVAIMLLINSLSTQCPNTTQIWYADDDSAAGTVSNVFDYWSTLSEIGPEYGYYPNASKTVLLCKGGTCG